MFVYVSNTTEEEKYRMKEINGEGRVNRPGKTETPEGRMGDGKRRRNGFEGREAKIEGGTVSEIRAAVLRDDRTGHERSRSGLDG